MENNEYPYAPDQFDREADRVGGHGAHRDETPAARRNLPTILMAGASILLLGVAVWIFFSFGGPKTEETAKPNTATTQSNQNNANKPAEQQKPADANKPATEAPKPAEPPKPAEAPKPAETPAGAKVDKTKKVMILNATRINGIAGNWKDAYAKDGWNAIETGTSSKKQDEPGVFYKNDADKATAAELAKRLGVEAKKSSEYKDDITVLVTKKP